MRVLVEQTRNRAKQWTEKVAPEVGVHTLMGGEVEQDWELHPEKPAILVGTQDMLLSRALNRGYSMTRFRWPVHFGLLNNDCLWVYDEVQSFGDGLATTSQLAAFREKMGVVGACPSIWMSATMQPEMLRTVDQPQTPELLELGEADLTALEKRLHAPKALAAAPEACRMPEGLARFVLDRHRRGTQTLVVVNRVERARGVFDSLLAAGAPPEHTHLLHSRFRQFEKKPWQTLLEDPPSETGRILVSTQVIEAGVDISSSLMVTDIAPYSSLVQRFGRCNRAGEIAEGAQILWVDRPLTKKQAKLADVGELTEEQRAEVARPYEPEELLAAAALLQTLQSAAPAELPPLPPSSPRVKSTHVLRRRDLVDLFDTTPDLSGYDLDVSRFIRTEDDRDVMVAWRDLGGAAPRGKARPERDELCSVPVGEISALLKSTKKGRTPLEAWSWNSVDGDWQAFNARNADQLRPGMTFWLDCQTGAYDIRRGWDPESAEPVPEVESKRDRREDEEALADDPQSFRRYTQTLAAHSREVREEMDRIIDSLMHLPLADFVDDLRTAALHHDWGKAHPVFQKTLHGGEADASVLLAKSNKEGRHERPYFRHELGSALALLRKGESDLAVYLTACHHGKVRLSIRAFPKEKKPSAAGVKFARGVYDGDILRAAQLDGIETVGTILDLEPMLLGAGPNGDASWLSRMIGLRDRLGVFRLAYLESLIVAADCRASADPKEVL